MALSTNTSISGYFNGILEDAIFVAREATLMTNLVTVYNSTGYATRTLPIYPQLTAQVVGEGVDFSNATEWNKSTQMTLSPQEIMTQVIITDRRIETDPDDARRDASIEMGNAIAYKVDTDLTGLFDNLSSSKGTAGSALTINHVAAALSVLRNRSIMGDKNVVLHPYQWQDIWTALGQPATNQAFLGDLANQALRDYYAGSWLSANWFTSANISADSSDDAYGAVLTREALAIDIRKAPNMEDERDPSLRAYELNMQMAYAVGVRRSTYGVGLLSDVTEPS